MPPRSRKHSRAYRPTNDMLAAFTSAPGNQHATQHHTQPIRGTPLRSPASTAQSADQIKVNPSSMGLSSLYANEVAAPVDSLPHTTDVPKTIVGNETSSSLHSTAASRKRKRRASQTITEAIDESQVPHKQSAKEAIQNNKGTARGKNVTRNKSGRSELSNSNRGSASTLTTMAEHATLESLPYTVQKKVRSMQRFIAHVDAQAGINYATVDEDGLHDVARVRMPARDFVAALKIVAVDFGIEHPDKVGYLQAQDMASFQNSTLADPPIDLQWAVVDFTQTCDIERQAQALVGGLGFDGRNIVGIECCMQTWQRNLHVAAGAPSALFRPDLDSHQDIANGFRSWSEAQQQGEREVQAAIQQSKQRFAERLREAPHVDAVTVFGMVATQTQPTSTTMASPSDAPSPYSTKAVCPHSPAHVV